MTKWHKFYTYDATKKCKIHYVSVKAENRDLARAKEVKLLVKAGLSFDEALLRTLPAPCK